MSKVAVRGPKWAFDEVRVLVAIYFSAQFSIGDDAQEECQLIADCFGRTPGSIDRQWRNIASVLKAPGTSHVGRLIGDCVQEYLDDPASCSRIAMVILDRRAWPLHELLEKGYARGVFQRATDSVLANELRIALRRSLSALDYRIFPSGSHGYALDSELDVSGIHFHVGISCVLADTGRVGPVDMKTSREEIALEIDSVIKQLTIKQSKTGRLVIHQTGKVVLHGERFNYSIRSNQVVGRTR